MCHSIGTAATIPFHHVNVAFFHACLCIGPLARSFHLNLTLKLINFIISFCIFCLQNKIRLMRLNKCYTTRFHSIACVYTLNHARWSGVNFLDVVIHAMEKCISTLFFTPSDINSSHFTFPCHCFIDFATVCVCVLLQLLHLLFFFALLVRTRMHTHTLSRQRGREEEEVISNSRD